MNTIERAAEVIRRVAPWGVDTLRVTEFTAEAAQALADAGLLDILEDRAVIDAAEALERWHEDVRARSTPFARPCSCAICAAVRARRSVDVTVTDFTEVCR